MSKLFTTIVPSLLAGGLLFGSALTGAQPAPPAPPAPPTATPAKPPKPPKQKVGVKADVHIDLGDIDEMVDEQIKNTLEAIGDNEQIPPHVREAVKQRLEKVRVKVKKRIAKLSPSDLEQLGEELGKMGDEIGETMDEFGKEMEKVGKELEKKMAKQLEKQMKGQKVFIWKGQHDDDFDHDDLPGMDDFDDADDLDAIKGLGNLKLDAGQRNRLKQLRAESDRRFETAKKQLDSASENLRRQLANDNADENQISRAIDDVTKAEAEIRKARILAWVKARRELDEAQRKQVEAARGKSR